MPRVARLHERGARQDGARREAERREDRGVEARGLEEVARPGEVHVGVDRVGRASGPEARAAPRAPRRTVASEAFVSRIADVRLARAIRRNAPPAAPPSNTRARASSAGRKTALAPGSGLRRATPGRAAERRAQVGERRCGEARDRMRAERRLGEELRRALQEQERAGRGVAVPDLVSRREDAAGTRPREELGVACASHPGIIRRSVHVHRLTGRWAGSIVPARR